MFGDGVNPETANLTWSVFNHKWTGEPGEISGPFYDAAVYEGGGDGPSSAYSAEINVSGKVIYGYNWNVRKTGDGPGIYRLTFSLDTNPVTCNTFFDEFTQVKPLGEESGVVSIMAEPEGGQASVSSGSNITYIDVEIIEASGRGGKGGK